MQTPSYDRNGIQLHIADTIEFARTMPEQIVDLTVTSPPYDELRDYTGEAAWGWDKFTALAEQLFRVTREGGVVVWNVNDQTLRGSESGSSFRQVLHFMDCGFNLADTMIYRKANPGGARGSNKTYIQSFEYMFVLSRGALTTYNLIRDRPNKRPGGQSGGGRRERDGTQGQTVRYESAELGRRFNIWEYPTQTDSFSAQHPAPFPLALARDHVISWSNTDDLVYDPFSGSGTTALAAAQLGRRAIGVDVSAKYVSIAGERIDQYFQTAEQADDELFGTQAVDPLQ